MESRLDRLHSEQVIDHYQGETDVTSAITMSVNDFVVKADTSSAALTATLPNVGEARGKTYTIKLHTGAGSGGAPNALTITTKGTAPNKDACRWNGDIILNRPGAVAVLFSDGEEWHKIHVDMGGPVFRDKRVHEMWNLPFKTGTKSGGGAPTGTAGDENVMLCGSGNCFEYHILGTQTVLGPDWTEPGLDIATFDQTENDGAELTMGISASSPILFTVGTDPAFFFKCRFLITNVSGTDDCAMGFRKREAYQANIDDYDEAAALNVISGDITIETILNGGATTSTDTTDDWGDAETHTLCVKVSSAGVVTYEIDDAAPTTTAAFTFDDGEVVIPFFYFLHAAAPVAGVVKILEWECGYQA